MKELRRVHAHVRNEDIEALIVKRKVECEKKRRRAEYKLFKLVDLDLFALITDNNYLISNSEDSSILADRTYNIPDHIKYEAFLESYGRGCLKSGRH